MGMYDTVLVQCPSCGTEEEFQSKGGNCVLACYRLSEAPQDVLSDVNRHGPSTCRHCRSVFGVELTYQAIPKLLGAKLAPRVKADIHAVLNLVKHLADQPCTKNAGVACRNVAQGGIDWMCPTCAAHHLVYVGNSL